MTIFADLVATKGSGTVLDRLNPVDAQTAAALASAHAPADYVDFISTVGSGELGDAAYMLYGGLVEPSEIYGEATPDLVDVVLFGDDFQGFNAGFDKRSWRVVEIDPTNMKVHVIAPNFEAFIRSKLAEI